MSVTLGQAAAAFPRVAVAAAVMREEALAQLGAILNTRVALNAHGAVELTDAQIETLKQACEIRTTGEDPAALFAGIPIWRADTERSE